MLYVKGKKSPYPKEMPTVLLMVKFSKQQENLQKKRRSLNQICSEKDPSESTGLIGVISAEHKAAGQVAGVTLTGAGRVWKPLPVSCSPPFGTWGTRAQVCVSLSCSHTDISVAFCFSDPWNGFEHLPRAGIWPSVKRRRFRKKKKKRQCFPLS